MLRIQSFNTTLNGCIWPNPSLESLRLGYGPRGWGEGEGGYVEEEEEEEEGGGRENPQCV